MTAHLLLDNTRSIASESLFDCNAMLQKRTRQAYFVVRVSRTQLKLSGPTKATLIRLDTVSATSPMIVIVIF